MRLLCFVYRPLPCLLGALLMVAMGSGAAGAVELDATKPTVSITAPVGGPVAGSVVLAASASDNVAVSKVRFWAGPTYLGYDTTAPYSVSWNTASGLNGAVLIKAQAVDTSNNLANASVTVTVINPDSTPPDITIIAPAASTNVIGTVNINANATDAGGMQKVQFWVDGLYLGYDSLAPYGKTWDSTTVSDGAHTVKARAIDWAGNMREATNSVMVANHTPPTVALVSPVGGLVSGGVTIQASASDDVAVSKVRFWVGATYLGYDSTAPYSASWDTAAGLNGVFVLKAQAVDTSNNVTSATVAVTVINPDSNDPTASIVSPAHGSGVLGVVPIAATASDAEGLQKVQFWVDGTYLGYDSSAPYTRAWNSSLMADGPHTLTARAVDWGNNTAQASVSVIVVNNDATPPAVSIISPDDGESVLGLVTLEATATDDLGVQKVDFWIDDGLVASDVASPYSTQWDSLLAQPGPHTIRARATDWAGNISLDSTIAVTSWLWALNAPAPTLEGRFGAALASGDVDGDGVDDLLVGATGEQRVYVYSGINGALLRVIDSPNPGAYPNSTNFGSTIATGDTNDDGFEDIIVGAPIEDSDPLPPKGKAYVFSGVDGSLIRTLVSPGTGGYFGVSVASGDVNGDLYADVIVGAYAENRVHVFSGLDGALLYTIVGNQPNTAFGIRVASGDVNNDGKSDVVAAAFAADNGRGRAYVFSGPSGQPIYSFASPSQQTDYYPSMLIELAVGDIDGDGYGDVVAAYPLEDVGGAKDRGRMYVYSGLDGDVMLTVDPPEPAAYVGFGTSIALAPNAIVASSAGVHPLAWVDGATWTFNFSGAATGKAPSPAAPNTSTVFGSSLAVVGSRLALGANQYTGLGPSMQGRVFVTELGDLPNP